MAAVADWSQHSLDTLVNNFSPGGIYGIQWQLQGDKLKLESHYNPQWRIDAVKSKGLNGLYTERSATYEFNVGQGYVGKTFAKQDAIFVKDLQSLSEESVKDCWQFGDAMEFLRADLAKEFDVHSAIFLPLPNGVLEVGSAAVLPSIPSYFASLLGQQLSIPASPPSTLASEEAPGGSAAACPPPFLKKLVEELSSTACYGIQWVREGDVLKFGSSYNPQWRIEGVKQQGLKGLYTTSSKASIFAHGEGLVGKAFAEQAVLFIKDLQMVTPDEAQGSFQTGSSFSFLRAAIAKDFGIHSAMFLPSPEGVLEVGSIQVAENLQAFLSEPAAAAIAGKGEAPEVLLALEALAA